LLYQLPNGKVIEMTIEQYIELTDEDLEYIIAFNYGEFIENIWSDSIINKSNECSQDIDDEEIDDYFDEV
jgi:hypothetical protein